MDKLDKYNPESRAEQSRAEQSRVELANCSFCKSVLMILVVMYHSMAFWLPGGWFNQRPVQESYALGLIASWLNSFHIYTFFLISGYVFYSMKYEKLKYIRFTEFVSTKAQRLLIPYSFVAIAWVIPIYCIFFRPSIGDLFEKFVLMESPSQLWFLIALFVIFVLFYPLSDFVNKHIIAGVCLMIFIYWIGLKASYFVPNVFQICSACRYILFFYLGFILRKLGISQLRRIPDTLFIMVDVGLFVLYTWINGMAGVYQAVALMTYFFLNVVGAVGAFVILERLAERIDIDSIIIRFFKSHSMEIYLFHQQVIYLVLTVGNGKIDAYILSAGCFVVSIMVSSIIAVGMNQFKLTKYLVSGKKK